MALTAQEQAELAQLESRAGEQSNLTPQEQAELDALEAQEAAQFDAKVVDEGVPNTWLARLGAKNLGTKSKETLDFVQRNIPKEYQAVRHPKTKDIFYSKENKNYPMDPSGFDPQDITDVMYDIPAGIAQGSATAAAALGAGALGAATPIPGAAPIAALGAGSATSVATGAALETGRQGLGAMMGINPPKLQTEDMSEQAAINAVTPLIFGSGVSKKAAVEQAKKIISDAGMGVGRDQVENTAKELLQHSKGLIGRGYDQAAGKVGSVAAQFLGGYPKEVLTKAREILPKIKAVGHDPAIYKQAVEEGRTTFNNALRMTRQQVGDQYGEALKRLDDAGVTIESDTIIAPFVRLKKEIQDGDHMPEAKKQVLDELEGIKKKYLYEKIVVPPVLTPQEESLLRSGADVSKMNIPKATERYVMRKTLKASDAKDISDNLSDLAQKYGMNYGNIDTTKSIADGTTAKAKDISRALIEAAKNARDQIDQSTLLVDPELRQTVNTLKGQYSAAKDLEEEFYKASSSNEGFARFLKRGNNLYKEQKNRMSQIAGRDMNDLAAEITAYDIFSDPSLQIPNFGQSTTGRQGRLGWIGAGLGTALGTTMGHAGEGALIGTLGLPAALSPVGVRKAMSMDQMVRETIPQYALPVKNKMLQELPQMTPYMMMQMQQEK